jgi:hypothetical protein
VKYVITLFAVLLPLVSAQVDTGLIQVGNKWEYYTFEQHGFTIPGKYGKHVETISSKQVIRDSIIFDLFVHDSVATAYPPIKDTSYKYLLVNGTIRKDSVPSNCCFFYQNEPLFLYGNDQTGSLSSIWYQGEKVGLLNWSNPNFQMLSANGIYLKSRGMIKMHLDVGATPNSFGQYQFVLLKFNNEIIDTVYILSKEAQGIQREMRNKRKGGKYANYSSREFQINGSAIPFKRRKAYSQVYLNTK